jgi:dipeptidyl aminopeptidase/acylaminoacyl peptidase
MYVDAVHLRSARARGLQADLELAATLYLPDPEDGAPAPGLVVGHGAGSHRARHDAFCREACSAGFAVLALDFRGHGDSSGFADGPLERDILAATSYLRDHAAVNGRHLCYRGSSMGGFYGLKAAPEAGFRALALLCPASERVILDSLEAAEEWPVGAVTWAGGAAQPTAPTRWDVPRLRAYFERQDSLALAAQIRCPVLLVHARADAVVPFEHSLTLARHLGGDVTLLALAGGTHTSAQHDSAIHRLTARWLLDQVRSAYTGRT